MFHRRGRRERREKQKKNKDGDRAVKSNSGSFCFLSFLCALCALCGEIFCAADTSRLAVIRTPADFTLTTQDDKPFRLSQLRGKIVLVSFVFTTCNGSCPATTHRMSLAEAALARADLLDKVHLVSITLDPARDKPAALREYVRLFDIESKHWTFLTGTPKQIDRVLSDWGMWARPTVNGQLDHPSRVFLLDGRGRVREIYDLQFFRSAWVREDVQLLLKESEALSTRP
jgi:protein SCO1